MWLSYGFDRFGVNYIMEKFPPERKWFVKANTASFRAVPEHFDKDKGCTYGKIYEVNPVHMVCSGTDSYNYYLTWLTKLEGEIYEIEVALTYANEIVRILYDRIDDLYGKFLKYSGS